MLPTGQLPCGISGGPSCVGCALINTQQGLQRPLFSINMKRTEQIMGGRRIFSGNQNSLGLILWEGLVDLGRNIYLMRNTSSGFQKAQQLTFAGGNRFPVSGGRGVLKRRIHRELNQMMMTSDLC